MSDSGSEDPSNALGGKRGSDSTESVRSGLAPNNGSEVSISFSETGEDAGGQYGHHVIPTNYKLVAKPVYFKALARTKSVAFYLSLIGSAVGFGNVWRFPKEVQQGGGLAYLIIYVICACVFAYPLCSLEIIYGQFSRSSPFDGGLLSGSPKGIVLGAGICGMVGLLTYYNILVVWVMMYLVKSFQQPWFPTNDDEDVCASLLKKADCLGNTCYYPYQEDFSCCTWNDATKACSADITGKSAGYFYNVQTMINTDWFYSEGNREGYGEGGYITEINWPQFGAHAVYVVLLFLATFGGRPLMNIVMYCTMIPAAVIVFGLLIFTFTLPGASHGASVLLFGEDNRFQYEALYDIDVWKTAIFQVIVSMSLGAFVVPVLSSECPFTQPVGIDSVIVSVADMIFGIISGFIIYGMMGFIADKVGGTVTDQASAGGASLIFVVYAAGLSAVSEGDTGSSWLHLMFWLMFWLLGFTSTVAIVTSLSEFFARTKLFRHVTGDKFSVSTGSLIMSGATCVVILFMGFLNCSDMGTFLVDPLDTFTSSLILPGTIFLGAFIFLWTMRSDKQKIQVGAATYYAMVTLLMSCMLIAGSARFLYNDTTSGIVYAVFGLLVPILSTFVIAGILTKVYGGMYWANHDRVFNGYFGDVLTHIIEVVNYDKPKLLNGMIFRSLSGIIRWLAVPFLGSILIDTIMIHNFRSRVPKVNDEGILIQDAGNFYPVWVNAFGALFLLAYLIILGIGFTVPKILVWFTDEDCQIWHGLFRRDRYAFGFFRRKTDAMMKRDSMDKEAAARSSVFQIEAFAAKRLMDQKKTQEASQEVLRNMGSDSI